MVFKSLPFPEARDVDHVVERHMEEWFRFDHEMISAAVTQWPARLRACVKVDGGHFEQFLMTVDE